MSATTSPRPTRGTRERSYGQDPATAADRLGRWLSQRRVRRAIGSFRGKRVGDFGCGFHAELVRPYLFEVSHAVLVDIALADDLKQAPNVNAIEGTLPAALDALEAQSLDFVLCNNVLEHLAEPREALRHFRRIVKPGGTCLFSVPSWRGKFFLELAAFQLRLIDPVEVEEHKDYFEREDLWRLLVSAGFKPSEITCGKHKLGLNTFAVCRVK
jgi:2-polyprenyl-3-methyl-5-hydroxy-6-metoxy-1,4-benzoquinol methylase